MTNEKENPQTQLPLEEIILPEKKKGFLSALKNSFITGFFVLAPAIVTFYFFKILVLALDGYLLNLLPQKLHPTTYLPYGIPGVGLIAGALVVLMFGFLARNVLGRRLVDFWETLMGNIPGVNAIYKAVRQVTDTLANSQSSFREVVLMEYPKEGCYSIGFITNKNKGLIQRTLEKAIDSPVVFVFVPTTPNPTSGFLLLVKKDDIIPLDMTVEQGLKAIISVGMVTPTEAEAKAALKAEKAEKNLAKKGKSEKAPATKAKEKPKKA